MARDVGGNLENLYQEKKKKRCCGYEGQEKISNFLKLTELTN